MRDEYVIAAAFDTETTNYRTANGWSAFVCLYIMNDLRDVNLRDYAPDCASERVIFARYEEGFHAFIAELVAWGKMRGKVPIVCAYNLMFDLQTVRYRLNREYRIESTAQSATNVYTVDLYEGEKKVCRFWDTFHLEMNGLRAMGRTCGVAKLMGEWDYSLVRTPETPLTDEELEYAKRDVQVIPAYLRYLLEANPWLEPHMLGSTVLTKTSIVRQMARNDIGNLKYRNRHGNKVTLRKAFELLCSQEMPRGFYDHALRLACFRGGFTFTSARFASRCVERVASLDVTSMHHAFITGRYIPHSFSRKGTDSLTFFAEDVMRTTREEVLSHYERPFRACFHARVRFKGLRLKEGSAFAVWHIGLLSEGKFKASSEKGFGRDERTRVADEANRISGWVDWAHRPVFAFGKLMSADEAVIHANELELWNISRVYEWESFEVILGEGTIKQQRPPDYVTLQSCLLFEQKSAAKEITKHYTEGESYPFDIPSTIPSGLADQLRAGALTETFFSSWYNSTVKGMFNGIYGTQAQNVYKPDYQVSGGEWSIDHDTIVNHENWHDMRKDRSMVLYPYGMRIVGGSRQHLLIAIELLFDAFGERIGITGGDTDSLKVMLGDVSTDALMDALTPLHEAVTEGIGRTMARARKVFPKYSSDLTDVGVFELEGIADEHYEVWNKARVSMKEGHAHVTCAGLSRPEGAFTIEDWIDARSEQVGFEQAVSEAIGYNSVIAHSVSHALQRTHPRAVDIFDEDVTDHEGVTVHVRAHEAIALYDADRELGATDKRANAENVRYLKDAFGFEVNAELKRVDVQEGKAVLDEQLL